MIIPINSNNDEYLIGQIVVLIKDIEREYVTITKGHELIIMNYNKDYDDYILKDEENNIIIKRIDKRYFTHKISYSEAKDIYIRKKEKQKLIEFIKSNCPHKDFDFWDRDKYDSCKLIKNVSFGNNECVCTLNCMTHIDKEKIDNHKFVKVYLRRIKINKLKDKC